MAEAEALFQEEHAVSGLTYLIFQRQRPVVRMVDTVCADVKALDEEAFHLSRIQIRFACRQKPGEIHPHQPCNLIQQSAMVVIDAQDACPEIGVTESPLFKQPAHGGFIRKLFASFDLFREQARLEAIEEIPVGRLGTPEDVAEAVLFLVSDGAGYITGEILDVNGGIVMD